MKARFIHHQLRFRFPAGTSRGILLEKPSAFIVLEENGISGIGECSVIPGLSIDPEESYHQKLLDLCHYINQGNSVENIDLSSFPSITFGLETALLDLKTGGKRLLFDNGFTRGTTGIPINGLVWMGDKAFMQKQISEKIAAGYSCIKLKIGALDFETEVDIIRRIRRDFPASEIELRLDANGGFAPNEALEKLKRLSDFAIHSIEQPIKPRQWDAMAEICRLSPIPVVLDEELIGTTPREDLFTIVRPSYIILKPSLIGGLRISEDWIKLAEKHKAGWWITSALEANIGLNAIAQWTSILNSPLPQGLGTGQLYHNNIPSPLEIRTGKLYYNTDNEWEIDFIKY